MAFNFNWSPLIADTERVRDMLTSALNKSPKPPIIVDDIIVNELNLGSTPPELEILEIGDLAEDRFRGIFKMSYTGDAYLTLKTRVQANPLNTYLSTKPSFASPQPLAASSSLTIPVQITLSDIRLSGFVILVFSKQKGITIVFRNDPLEKLKVSSTFDSIPFVRDYLQKTIENQLRVLFMEDLPAIIHQLSLRLFDPEYQTTENQRPEKNDIEGEKPIDPLASPLQQPVGEESTGSTPFSLDPPSETYASFSQKNLLRLAALTESQRTLSLFTPGIRDTVYRAWANAAHRDESSQNASASTRPTTLSRMQSLPISRSVWSSAASQTSDGSHATRPTLNSVASTTTTYSLTAGAPRSRPGKKRKHRVVNLRSQTDTKPPGGGGDGLNDLASLSSGYEDSASRSHAGGSSAKSSNLLRRDAATTQPTTTATTAPSSYLPYEGEISTPPPRSPKKRVGFRPHDGQPDASSSSPALDTTPKPALRSYPDPDSTPRASTTLPPQTRPRISHLPRFASASASRSPAPDVRRTSASSTSAEAEARRLQSLLAATLGLGEEEGGSSGGILEQAWMQKMAVGIAGRVGEEKARRRSGEGEEAPPPAYGV